MEEKRARELLAAERKQVETELAALRGDDPEESDARREPGDRDDEGLYQDEFDKGREQDLERKLEAVEAAEQRLADGTYGLSVKSGEPIPDERLEVQPTAELTVDEAHGGRG
jgi:DnaK suppressor protein